MNARFPRSRRIAPAILFFAGATALCCLAALRSNPARSRIVTPQNAAARNTAAVPPASGAVQGQTAQNATARARLGNPPLPTSFSAPLWLPERVGERRVYSFAYDSTAASELNSVLAGSGAEGAGAQSGIGFYDIETSASGEMLVTLLRPAKAPMPALASVKLRRLALRLSLNSEPAPAQARHLIANLGHELWVAVNASGRIQGVRFDPALQNDPIAATSGGYARAMLGFCQWVFPARPDAREGEAWSSLEDDPNGAYRAHYSRAQSSALTHNLPRSGVFAFTKTKTYFEPRRNGGESGASGIEVVGGGFAQARVTLDGRGRATLQTLDADEKPVARMGDKVLSRSRNRFRLRPQRTETVSKSELARLLADAGQHAHQSALLPLSVQETEVQNRARIARSSLGSATISGLLAQLDEPAAQRVPAGNDTSAWTPLFLQVKALLVLQPQTSATFGLRLLRAPAQSPAFRVVAEALAIAGHAPAQNALSRAVRARRDDERALSVLLPLLTSLRTPTPEVEAAVSLVARSSDRDIAATGWLTLGALAHTLNAPSSAPQASRRAASLVDKMTSQLNTAASPRETRVILLALGNASSPRALPVLLRFRQHAVPEVRAGAVLALRGIEAPEAEAPLLQTLAADSSADVRREAAYALSQRAMSLRAFKAQQNALKTETDVRVRLTLLRSLWAARVEFPAARSIVASFAQDTSPDVSEAAARLLAEENK